MRVTVLPNAVAPDAALDDADVLVQAEAVAAALAAAGHDVARQACTLDLSALAGALTAARPDLVFNLVESLGGYGRLIHLAPAVLFLRESTGADDPHDLVGRVKEEAKLTILGADAYMDSVILEDNAYDVTRGFAAVPAVNTGQVDAVTDLDATLLDDDEEPTAEPPPASPPPGEAAAADAETDAKGEKDGESSDELAELLLKALK